MEKVQKPTTTQFFITLINTSSSQKYTIPVNNTKYTKLSSETVLNIAQSIKKNQQFMKIEAWYLRYDYLCNNLSVNINSFPNNKSGHAIV
jgi:hypothetical protein